MVGGGEKGWGYEWLGEGMEERVGRNRICLGEGVVGDVVKMAVGLCQMREGISEGGRMEVIFFSNAVYSASIKN
jgi:hypothetical protein